MSKSLTYLKKFVERLDADDNRSTARPILWCLQKKVITYYPVWNEGGWWTYPDWEGDPIKANSVEEALEICKKELDCEFSESDLDECDRVERWETIQTFLTKDGLDRHIIQNKHNLGEYRDYVIHAWRDPELKELYDAIRDLVKDVELKCE